MRNTYRTPQPTHIRFALILMILSTCGFGRGAETNTNAEIPASTASPSWDTETSRDTDTTTNSDTATDTGEQDTDDSDTNDADSTTDETETTESNASIVCLSPGHPSYEGDKYYEAVINRKVMFFLQTLLEEAAYATFLTGDDIPAETLFLESFDNESDTYWPLLQIQTPEEKALRCNEADADYVISIHHNFAYNPQTNHTLVFYAADENYRPQFPQIADWAELTADRLGSTMKTSGSTHIADLVRLGFSLGILLHSDAPGILTEASFYSNEAERNRLNDNRYLQAEAEAIFEAFIEHQQ